MRLRLLSPHCGSRSLRNIPLLHFQCRASILTPLRKMSFSTETGTRTYEDALKLLNTLQTPHAILQDRLKKGIRLDASANQEMLEHLKHIGYSQQDLTNLNIIHVAGTKGKGSTCAFTSSILTHHFSSSNTKRPRKKIGLFTSPHLIHVRERIRINNRPISAALFTKYFFEVWDLLSSSSPSSTSHSSSSTISPNINDNTNPTNTPGKLLEKPVYFRYLTLLSYHVFIQEKVDVAIYEVGIGGEYDSTNIVSSPSVTGISALGIDHVFSLGSTVESIAWHKAGIQKPHVPSFTVPQPSSALQVVRKRAEERGVSSFSVVEQDPRLRKQNVGIKPDEEFQYMNASLAIKLAETVLRKVDPEFVKEEKEGVLSKGFVDGLEMVEWRGRCEVKTEKNIKWYLDGAHTADSLEVAAKWYGHERVNSPIKTTTLIFNQQGHRDALPLLISFHSSLKSQIPPITFSTVIFCPTVLLPSSSSSTTTTTTTTATTPKNQEFVNEGTDKIAIKELTLQKEFKETWLVLEGRGGEEEKDGECERRGVGMKEEDVLVMSSVEEAMKFVREQARGKEGKGEEVGCLVTGSVHLVGRVLGVMEDEEGGDDGL